MKRDPERWRDYSYTVESLDLKTLIVELVEERIEEDRYVKIRIRLDDQSSERDP